MEELSIMFTVEKLMIDFERNFHHEKKISQIMFMQKKTP